MGYFWDMISMVAEHAGKDQALQIVRKVNQKDGGPGSGNFGHKGRAGKRGGSSKRGEGGGAQHLKKQSMSAAKSADNEKFKKVAQRALNRLPKGTILCSGKQDNDGYVFRKSQDGLWRLPNSDDGLTDEQMTRSLSYEDQGTYLRAATKGQQDLWKQDNDNWEKSKGKIDRIKQIKQAAKEWKSKVPKHYLDHALTGMMIKDYQPSQALRKNSYYQNAYFKAMGQALGWEKMKQQGTYDLLSKQQRDTLLMLQSKGFDMAAKKSGVEGQDNFLEKCSGTIRDMYDCLMAKALGVDITPPAIDSSLVVNYLRQHPDYQPLKSIPDQRGYKSPSDGSGTKKIMDAVRNHRAFRDVPQSQKHIIDVITDSVEKMDQDIQPYVMRSIDKLRVAWTDRPRVVDGGADCYYNPSTGYITISTMDSYDTQRSPQQISEIFWHEFGHFFADQCKLEQKIKDVDISSQIIYGIKGVQNIAVHNKAYNDATKKDLKKILSQMGASKARPFQGEGRGGTMVTQDGEQCVDPGVAIQLGSKFYKYMKQTCITQKTGEQWGKEAGIPQDPKWDDYMQTYFTPKRRTCKSRQRFKGAKQQFRKALQQASRKRQQFFDSYPGGKDGYYDQFMKHQSAYNQQQKQISVLCDMVGQMSLGTIIPVLGGTHSAEYYRRHNEPAQTAAQMFNMLARGQTFALDSMKKIMPNVYQVMLNAIKFRG